MIQDLDNSIKALLARELSHVVTSNNISFDTPDTNFKPKTPAINCFLYEVSENRELRSNEWLLERRADGSATQLRSPVRVDCNYLISVWADNINTEHSILGELIKTFSTYSEIPSEVLQESLQKQQPAVILQPGNIENLIEYWKVLGVKPRPALSYTLTISMETSKPEEVLLVKERIIDLRVEKEIIHESS